MSSRAIRDRARTNAMKNRKRREQEMYNFVELKPENTSRENAKYLRISRDKRSNSHCMYLSKGAIDYVGLSNGDHISVYYDKDKDLIGIKLSHYNDGFEVNGNKATITGIANQMNFKLDNGQAVTYSYAGEDRSNYLTFFKREV